MHFALLSSNTRLLVSRQVFLLCWKAVVLLHGWLNDPRLPRTCTNSHFLHNVMHTHLMISLPALTLIKNNLPLPIPSDHYTITFDIVASPIPGKAKGPIHLLNFSKGDYDGLVTFRVLWTFHFVSSLRTLEYPHQGCRLQFCSYFLNFL